MALNISLNGSNYVSDKTREAFEQVLQEAGSRRQESRSEDPTTYNSHPPTLSPQSSSLIPQHLETLDRALTQSYEHQTLTMRVHEQYLNNQSDYASIFSQLMQQQGAIFANGVANGASSQQAETAATVLETLARSMTRFHDLQEQTLDVHKQFLAQQSDYARAALQLMREQHTTVLKGNGNGHHPNVELKVKSQLGSEAKASEPPNYESDKTSRQVADHEPAIEQPAPHTLQPLPQNPPAQPSTHTPQPSTHNPQPSTLNPQPAALTASLLTIVSDKTGYPVDMLELDMDMEADLGIDSIKRVEILGALQEAHPDLPEVETDVLAELRTLAQIVNYMSESVSRQASDMAPSIESPASSIKQPKKA